MFTNHFSNRSGESVLQCFVFSSKFYNDQVPTVTGQFVLGSHIDYADLFMIEYIFLSSHRD